MFRIYEVPADAAIGAEQLGTKQKFWFDAPDLGRCLCKLARKGTVEDWSEKVAGEVAALLSIPHAAYELASFKGQRCVISPRFVADNAELKHGNELIRELDDEYAESGSRFRQSGHTIDAVLGSLRSSSCGPPPATPRSDALSSPVSVFIGYLMLDVLMLIGNTDRHHENRAGSSSTPSENSVSDRATPDTESKPTPREPGQHCTPQDPRIR